MIADVDKNEEHDSRIAISGTIFSEFTKEFFISRTTSFILKLRIMKKLMLLTAVAGLIATSVFAQKEQDKGMKKDYSEWEKKIKDELKLTDEQTVKFDALSLEYKGKIDAIMQDANLTKDVQKEKKMALKKEKETRLLELFTPEQQAKYKELMEKKKKGSEAAPKASGA